MQRSVSGTWAEARATAARFCSCAFSIRFCTTRVKRYSSGKTTSRINASPRFSAKITARMPHRRQASANMLMMPEVNSSSTVSTSPTKRETAAPDSWFTKASAGSLSSLAHMALRRAWVILWPNTVSKLSRRESNPPESASSPKYPNASAKGTTCRAVRRSTTRPSTSGGSRLAATAPATASTSAVQLPRMSSFLAPARSLWP